MYYLRYFGMIFQDSTYDYSNDQKIFNVLLFIFGIVSMILLPFVSLEFDDYVAGSFSSISATACNVVSFSIIFSSLIKLYNMKYKYHKYKKTLESFDIYIPTNALCSSRIQFSSLIIISICVIVILPVNSYKLWNIFHNHSKPVLMTSYFLLHYIENFCLCCTEIHFVIQCLTVLSKFRDINNDLKKLGAEINKNDTEKSSMVDYKLNKSMDHSTLSHVIVYENEFYRPKNKGFPLTNIIELLRIKHWIAREAIKDLNNLFGIHLGLSIFHLIIITLFDVYAEVFHSYMKSEIDAIFRTSWQFMLWMLQYSFRFSMIVITAQNTTKQVNGQ